jgi:hypothetical protein
MRALIHLALSILLLLATLAAAAPAQTVPMPSTEGTTLADQRVVIADAVKGKPALLIITFSRKAGDKAAEWRKELRQTNLPGPKYAFYQLAELEDVPRIIRWSVVSGIRRGIPAAEHGTFIILTKDTEQWKKFVGFKNVVSENEDDPYLLVLDASGHIKARITGKSPALVAQLIQSLK